MTNKIRYYEYQLKAWNDIDEKEEMCAGIVSAATITEAMKEIEDYYGDDIEEVQMLKAITDGVFDFESVREDTYFDFVVSKKI